MPSNVLFLGSLACDALQKLLIGVHGGANTNHFQPLLVCSTLPREGLVSRFANGVIERGFNGGVGEHEVLHVEWFADLQLGGFLCQAGALWEGGNVVLGLGLVHELPVVSLHYEHGAGHHGEVHVVEVLLCGRRAEDQLDAQALDLRGEQVVLKVFVHGHGVVGEAAVVLGHIFLHTLWGIRNRCVEAPGDQGVVVDITIDVGLDVALEFHDLLHQVTAKVHCGAHDQLGKKVVAFPATTTTTTIQYKPVK